MKFRKKSVPENQDPAHALRDSGATEEKGRYHALASMFDNSAAPLMRLLGKTQVSETELTALTAGDVSIERGFFAGYPQWKEVRALPKYALSTEEKAFIDGPVNDIAKRANWIEAQKRNGLPPDIYESIKKNKLFGLIISKENGGLGFSATANSEVIIRLSSMSVVLGVEYMVPNSLGPGELLMHYGTQAQKKRWLPRLADGREIPCFALTSENGGSDAAGGMMNEGEVFLGDDGMLKIRMDISNRYSTLSPIATLAGVAFNLRDPGNLLGKGNEPGITLALIPRNTKNFVMKERHPLAVPFQNGPLEGKDVVIDVEDNIIGGSSGVGQGWNMVMQCLAVGRSISLPALCASAAKTASEYAGAYAYIRNQFGVPICRFEGVEEKLANIAGMTYIIDSGRKMTLQIVAEGKKPTIPSAIIKYHSTEMMRTICNNGMDIMAGSGIVEGPRNVLSEFYKAVPIGITVEGSNTLTRNLIIYGQGLLRAHPRLYPIIEAAKSGDKKRFGALIRKHGVATMGNLASSELGIGINAGIQKGTPKEIREYYRQINHLSSGFAFTSAVVAALYRDKLKAKENVSRRLGDVLSNLYLSMSVLNNFEMDGMQEEDLPLVHWSCQHLMHEAGKAFSAFLDNLPNRMVAAMLGEVIFSDFAKYKAPSDELNRKVASIITTKCKAKERLTNGIYRPKRGEKFTVMKDDGSVVETEVIKQQSIIMEAMEVCMAAEPAEAKLNKAIKGIKKSTANGGSANSGLPCLTGVINDHHKSDKRSMLLSAAVDDGVITEEECRLVKNSDYLRSQVIKVDTEASKNAAITEAKRK